MKRSNWIWQPHAGHCIVGNDCRFHLNTYVGKYIVSTIGEYWPDIMVRRIHAQVHDIKWFKKHWNKQGDNFDFEYFKKFGYIELGLNRTYETMVFQAKKVKDSCCAYQMINGASIDFKGYNKAIDAMKGHLTLCKKWSNNGKTN